LKIKSKIASLFIIIIIFAFVYPPQIKADSNSSDTLEGEITNIYKEEQIKFDYSEGEQLYQELEVKITKGENKDSKITVKNGHYPMTNVVKYKIGNKVIINKIKNIDGTTDYVITDFVRRTPMLVLAIIFAVLTILIGKLRGASSLLGLLVSFAVIFGFIVPRIYAGDDPVSIVIVGSLLIIPATFYLSHGLNRKTTVAIFGTLVALILTGILANIFVAATNLTGYTSDEASFIQSIAPDKIFDVRNLLLAGIIIGVLGVLDDVTVSQSSVVEELKKANNKLKNTQLFTRAMSVGQDHISSMVNLS